MGISPLAGKHLKNFQQIVTFDHRLQCNCVKNFDDLNILAEPLISLNHL